MKSIKPVIGMRGLLLAILPLMVLSLYAWNPVWRIYSDHGFMHQAIVYGISNGILPPFSPTLTGYPINYPWAHHALVALIARPFDLPLSWVFGGLNILALCLALFGAVRIGRLLDDRTAASLLAALLAVVSCNVMTRGPIVDAAQFLLSGIGFPYAVWEYKALVFAKFYNVNSNGIGIAIVLLWMLASLRYINEGTVNFRSLLKIAAAASALAFVYPIYALNLAGTLILLFGLSVVIELRAKRWHIFAVGAATAFGFLLAAPYLAVVSGGRTTAALQLTHDLAFMAQKGVILVLALSLPALVILLSRETYRQLFAERRALLAFLIVFILVSGSTYVLLEQAATEYKHLLIATVAAGLLAAPGFMNLVERRRWLGGALLISVLVPPVSDWLDLMDRDKWPAFQHVVEDGATLRHPESSQESLYAWIRTNSSPEDAFIDDRLLIPVLGQRSLYFGTDGQWQEVKAASGRLGADVADGWEQRPEQLAQQQGYDSVVLARRRQLVEALLVRAPSRAQLAQLTSERRSIYLVARNAELRAELAAQKALPVVFQSNAADIYRLTEAPDASPAAARRLNPL